jgi:hypothetical protein
MASMAPEWWVAWVGSKELGIGRENRYGETEKQLK